MPRCCGGASCSCVIHAGQNVTITGIGSPSDPFIIHANVVLTATDGPVFDLAVTGDGTVDDPWTIEAQYTGSAQLTDHPNVDATTVTDGQVLAYDAALGKWVPRAPVTATAGTVLTDTSLTGDGAVGTPLQVQENPDRLLSTTAAGLGLSDEGMNSVVRRFADTAERDAATPGPVANALSILGTVPGQIDYWDGAAWVGSGNFDLDVQGEEFYQMSGPYTADRRITYVVRNVATSTDTDGQFDAISALDLAGKAGVLTATVTPTLPGGPGSVVVPYGIMLAPSAGGLRGVAYRIDNGEPLSLSQVACTVVALTY